MNIEVMDHNRHAVSREVNVKLYTVRPLLQRKPNDSIVFSGA